MVFLNGALLAFLGALGLPLLVHLLNLRRRRAQDIPTLRFLKEIESTRLKRVKLNRWLLLLVRTLFLLALILAFARPVLTRGAGLLGGSGMLPGAKDALSLVLLLDDSASSRLPADGGGTIWDGVRRLAQDRLARMDEKDRVWILPLSRPGELTGPLDPEAAGRRLAELGPSWSAAQLETGLERVLAELDRLPVVQRQLLLIGDARLPLLLDWSGRLPENLDRGLVQVPGLPGNAAPLALGLRGGLLMEDRPLALQADLAGSGARDGLEISVSLEGETRLRKPLGTVADGEWRRQEDLEFRLAESGWLRGVVRLDGDGIPLDDELPFVLHVPEQRRVLMMPGDDELGRVLVAALQPDARYRRGLTLDLAGGADFERLDPLQVDQIVFALGQPLSTERLSRLREFSARGARLLLLPAADADAVEVSRQLRELGLPGLAGIREATGGVWRMEGFDLSHEILTSIVEPGQAPEAVPVRRLLELESGGSLSVRTLAQAGGRPAILALEGDKRRVLLLLTAPVGAWSDLASSGLCAPLLQQGLRWLDGDERLLPALSCGIAERIAPPRGVQGTDWRLLRDGMEWRLENDPRRGWLLVPPLPEPGHYRLQVDGRMAGWLAVRIPEGETTREAVPAADWSHENAGGWRVLDGAMLRRSGSEAAGLEATLLLLALILLAGETLLATGRGKE